MPETSPATPVDASPAVLSLRSLHLRTELALLERAGSVVEERGTHLVVRTPDNPDFYWGNFLLLRDLPLPGGAREVMGACFTEFPASGHRAITFDLTEPLADDPARAAVLEEFTTAGMKASRSVALTALALEAPARPHPDAVLRPLASDADWEQRVELAAATYDGAPGPSFDAYARGRVAAERALEEQGLGHRWGAFVDDRLVSTAALYRVAGDVARYQVVETHPEARRQGLAGSLVHAVGTHGLSELGAGQLVIVADADDEAIRLYRALGFTDAEETTELEQRPGS
ncbi:GNAT family N-acetyltransferase [Nocardioides solisilvae]|uniref:GNAT family N-acetyltransferase n=1 Tax=Nocardioides solisilvae TaxID=1542435 RepID=UPI000D744D6B|nr:GNAT family N-acetyltransferase [Nocardioides solisilvae]